MVIQQHVKSKSNASKCGFYFESFSFSLTSGFTLGFTSGITSGFTFQYHQQAKLVTIHFRDNQVCVTIMDLSHLTQLPPAFMNETQKTVGLKAWMTCLSVEQVRPRYLVQGQKLNGPQHFHRLKFNGYKNHMTRIWSYRKSSVLNSVWNQMIFKLFSNREFNCHNHLSSRWKGPWTMAESFTFYSLNVHGCLTMYVTYFMTHTVWVIQRNSCIEIFNLIIFSAGADRKFEDRHSAKVYYQSK